MVSVAARCRAEAKREFLLAHNRRCELDKADEWHGEASRVRASQSKLEHAVIIVVISRVFIVYLYMCYRLSFCWISANAHYLYTRLLTSATHLSLRAQIQLCLCVACDVD